MDVSALFSRAEQAFVAGRVDEAHRDLQQVLRATGDHPAVLHLLALVEKRRGNAAAAAAAFETALALDPSNVEIATNAGNFYSSIDQPERALDAYQSALKARPTHLLALLGRAQCLGRLRREGAREAYERAASVAPTDARPWTGLGALERQEGDLAAAAAAFERALALNPSSLAALHGRARVALERGESDAAARYMAVAAAAPNDPEVALGAAEAVVNEDAEAGLARLSQVVERYPEWPDAHSALARLKWELGDREGFSSALEASLEASPHNVALWQALVGAYSGVDLHREAADAAARAAKALQGDTGFRLLEADSASRGGELDRAERLFASLPRMAAARVSEARHRLKLGDVERAGSLLDAARTAAPDDIEAWAWTGLVWRLTDDPRSAWLFRPGELTGISALPVSSDELGDIAAKIRRLHHASAFPIGQSLRGGKQTRGRLFDRVDDAARRLRSLIGEVVSDYWHKLPAEDREHPLLKHRNQTPRFAGSWSVQLTGAGFHVAHIHPRGLLSSACYLALPELEGEAGRLELGRPPVDLELDLAPLEVVEPKPGRLALFPSYLHHGTVPFAVGERLTVAFDIIV